MRECVTVTLILTQLLITATSREYSFNHMPCKLDTLCQMHDGVCVLGMKAEQITVQTGARQAYCIQLLICFSMACNSSRTASDTCVEWEAHIWVYILVTAARGPLASAPMTTDLRRLALPLLIPLS